MELKSIAASEPLFPRATSQAAACRHLATAGRVFDFCCEDMIDRKSREVLWREKKNVSYEYYIS